jgi:hypothetical protein
VTTIICIILAFFFKKLQPCSVEFINAIEFRVYIFLIIVNAAGVLCYFIGIQTTLITFGVLLFLYIIYTFLSSIKVLDNFNFLGNEPQATDELTK